MRTAITLLLLLVTGPGWAQEPQTRAVMQVQLATSVLTAALSFIPARALESVTVQQLALWGLTAPTALDPALATDIRDGAVVLLQNGAVLFQRPLPPGGGAAEWSALIADLLNAAVTTSPAMREAGLQGALVIFFDELFNHLDPYSRYLPLGAADEDRARRSGDAGAGITIKRVGRTFIVTDVNASGPGAEAGIHVGDQLLAVDDQPTAGEDLDTVQAWIAGPEGTELSLTVRSRGAAPRTLDMDRATIPPESVFATRMSDILLLRITRFSDDTGDRVARELTRHLTGAAGRPIRSVIVDLRGNRGGKVSSAIAATDHLLDAGVIATSAGRDPAAAHVWRATQGDLAVNRPLIVLVDGRSASAAEIMAAALADNGRAVVVGSATLGKGLVQAIIRLPDEGELFLSWSRVLAPRGWPIQTLGVLPQVCTSLGQDATNQQLTDLDHGAQPLADALARHRAARAPLPAAEALALRNACPASEARDADMAAARFLTMHPHAYAAARLSPP